MDIEIVVIGESSKWVLNQSRIRIGQDPKCEVSLPGGKYPSVSGEHVALDVVDGAVKLVKGMRAGVETFLNGHPAGDGATIRSGDVLRLGAGGPELRIRLLPLFQSPEALRALVSVRAPRQLCEARLRITPMLAQRPAIGRRRPSCACDRGAAHPREP